MCFEEAGSFYSPDPLTAYKVLRKNQQASFSVLDLQFSPPYSSIALSKEWLVAEREPLLKAAAKLLDKDSVVGFSCFPLFSSAKKWKQLYVPSPEAFGIFEVKVQGIIRIGVDVRTVFKYFDWGFTSGWKARRSSRDFYATASTSQYQTVDMARVAWAVEQIKLVSYEPWREDNG